MDDNDILPSDDGGLVNETELTVQAAANATENVVGQISMVAVDSSDIAAWGYDPTGFRLQIQFRKNNYIYIYSNVSPLDFETLVLSPSKGKAFWQYIRRYPTAHPWTRIQ